MFMFEYNYISFTEVFCIGTCGESHPFTGTNFLFEYCNCRACIFQYKPW